MADSNFFPMVNEKLVTLPGSGGVEVQFSRRKVFLSSYYHARLEFAESIGSTSVEVRVEWKDESGNWQELVPWTSGVNGSEDAPNVSSTVDVPSEAQGDGDVFIRVMCRAGALQSPILRYVVLDLFP